MVVRRKADRALHFRVGHGSVAEVGGIAVFFTRRIGGAHPGGPALRRTVQENFHTADLEVAVINARLIFGEIRAEIRHSGIADHVDLQKPALQKLLPDGKQFRDHHSVLNGCDSVGQILRLRLFIGMQQLFRVRRGDLPNPADKIRLLHISGRNAVCFFNKSARCGRRVAANAELLHGGGVEYAHMTGLVLQSKRPSAAYAVEHVRAEQPSVGAKIEAAVDGYNPFIRTRICLLNIGFYFFTDRFCAV